MAGDDVAVTAGEADAPIDVQGVDHVTVTGSNVEDTIAFYRDLLGMELVVRQPNLDEPALTHLFFDAGDGRLVTFFVAEDRPSNPVAPDHQIGEVHHLAFRVRGERLAAVKSALESEDHRYNEFDRGAFHSLYTRDNNGLTIELTVPKYEIPDDRRGEVLARAHANRVADGSAYVDDRHLEAALEDLGLPNHPRDLPDAPAGSSVDAAGGPAGDD